MGFQADYLEKEKVSDQLIFSKPFQWQFLRADAEHLLLLQKFLLRRQRYRKLPLTMRLFHSHQKEKEQRLAMLRDEPSLQSLHLEMAAHI